MSLKSKRLLGWAACAHWLVAVGCIFAFLLVVVLAHFVPSLEDLLEASFGYLVYLAALIWFISINACLVAFFICGKHLKDQNVGGATFVKFVLLLGPLWPIGTPIYWYFYIWRGLKVQ